MRPIISATTILVLLVAHTASASAILRTDTDVLSSTIGFAPLCGDGGENVTDATSSCGYSLSLADGIVTTFEGSATATASFGTLGAESSAIVINGRVGSILSGGTVVSAASMTDVLPNLPAQGAISFEFVLDGCAVNDNAGLARGEVHFVNRTTATNLNLGVDYYSDTNQVSGPAQVTSTGECSVTIETRRLPVSLFPLGFTLAVGTEVSVGAITEDLVTASGEANFLHTLTLNSISVFDANGAPITDPNVGLGESGMRYAVNSVAAPLPEPASAMLFGMGLLCVARRARRRG